MPIRMRLTIRRPLATAATAASRQPWADTPTPTLDLSRTSARVPFIGGTAASAHATAGKATVGTATAAPAPAPLDGMTTPHPTHRAPKGGR
ncbi:hypothetical protein [Streptomyces sp. AC512_CC834]|uniref:hypothetical protein n=1 Tax=Streptomyces sp. AC512_CC834 TaxID=2823691 RepID=UPI0020B7638D|nr:hypothetical protein [Streptomyces sp. AC512_CC834]